MKQDVEEIIKSWTPKPMVDKSQIKKLPMEKYVIESKVKFLQNYKFSIKFYLNI